MAETQAVKMADSQAVVDIECTGLADLAVETVVADKAVEAHLDIDSSCVNNPSFAQKKNSATYAHVSKRAQDECITQVACLARAEQSTM